MSRRVNFARGFPTVIYFYLRSTRLEQGQQRGVVVQQLQEEGRQGEEQRRRPEEGEGFDGRRHQGERGKVREGLAEETVLVSGFDDHRRRQTQVQGTPLVVTQR